jgi:hypothetical protein
MEAQHPRKTQATVVSLREKFISLDVKVLAGVIVQPHTAVSLTAMPSLSCVPCVHGPLSYHSDIPAVSRQGKALCLMA